MVNYVSIYLLIIGVIKTFGAKIMNILKISKFFLMNYINTVIDITQRHLTAYITVSSLLMNILSYSHIGG